MSLPKLFFHSFETWASLKSRLSRNHSRETQERVEICRKPLLHLPLLQYRAILQKGSFFWTLWSEKAKDHHHLCFSELQFQHQHFRNSCLLTTICYYERGVQVLQIQIIKVKWMFRIVNHLSLMTVKVMILLKRMSLLFLTLETTFSVCIRRTVQDVAECIVALVLHQV